MKTYKDEVLGLRQNEKQAKMELNKFSKQVTQDDTQPAAQAMLHAIGLSKSDLENPCRNCKYRI